MGTMDCLNKMAFKTVNREYACVGLFITAKMYVVETVHRSSPRGNLIKTKTSIFL